MRLPIELLESIIDDLASDPTSLKNCSLASSVLLQPSQRHLFSTLTIQPPQRPRGDVGTTGYYPISKVPSVQKKRYDILIASPHLAAYVHTLHLHDVATIWLSSDDALDGSEPKRAPWIALEAFVPRLLALLPAVRRLIWDNGPAAMLSWGALPGETRRVLGAAMARWPLVEVGLAMVVGFPLGVLRGARSLQRLSLRHTHFTMRDDDWANGVEEEGREGSSSRKLLSLKSMRIESPSRHLLEDLVSWLEGNVELADLQEIAWNTYGEYFRKGEDMTQLLRIINLAAPSLQKLEVTPSMEGPGLQGVPALTLPPHDYPNLQSLSLGFEVTSQNPSSFLWAKSSLEQIVTKNSPNLEAITLKCHLVQESPLAEFDSDSWASIRDSIMTRTTAAPLAKGCRGRQLEKVDIHAYAVYSDTNLEMGEVVGRIRGVMAPLETKVTLSVANFS